MNRRHFLLWGAGAIGAGALSCAGLGILATRTPRVERLEMHCEQEETMPKVLVAYATRAGTTGEVAEAIGSELCASGYAAEVLPAKEVRDLSPYDAVIVGSPIYVGKWMSDAAEFVTQHQAALQNMPVAFFLTCLTIHDPTPEDRETVAAYLQPQRELVTPVAEGHLVGAFVPQQHSLLFRLMMRLMKSPSGDFRDWEAIRQWAQDVGQALKV